MSHGPAAGLAVPHPWLLTPFEPLRAGAELATVPFLAPFLLGGPASSGLPVVVVPGLGGGNGWTLGLRTHLRVRGHAPHKLHARTMLGVPAKVVQLLIDRVDEVAEQTGAQVGLVGWSVGGAFARQVALARPDLVRLLVTLGAPLDGRWYTRRWSTAKGSLPVPTTAVYSRTDGIFDWRRCVQVPTARAENVEIVSSHLGMGTHPAALHVTADRLGQPAGTWVPYRSPFSWPDGGQPPDPASSI